MDAVARAARVAGQALAGTSAASRNGALEAIAAGLSAAREDIVRANARDLAAAAEAGLPSAVQKVSSRPQRRVALTLSLSV